MLDKVKLLVHVQRLCLEGQCKNVSDSGAGWDGAVLLDHGLYRDLDENFRSNYCRLWRALILLDPDELQDAGRHLGAGEFYRYLPVIFTGRSITRYN